MYFVHTRHLGASLTKPFDLRLERMKKTLLAVMFLLAFNRPQIADDHAGKAPLLREPISLLTRVDFWQGKHKTGPKTCTEVFPLPKNMQKWTNCQQKDVSECGGPQECVCNVDERLLTYICSEGTYRACEEDDSCHPDSPSL